MARRRLRSGVPRAYRDHRRRAALAYREAVGEIRRRLGLDGYTGPLLKEYGILVVDLDQLHAEAEALQGNPRRRRDLARLQRRRVAFRSQLITLERRLQELALERPRTPSLAEYLQRHASEDGKAP